MELWSDDDYETPIESYLGYLGLYFDGSFSAETELKPLQNFDFRKYGELVEEHGGPRQLEVHVASGPIKITVRAYDGIVELLDQLPTVTVYLDNGPPGAGPASGGTYVFFMTEGVSEADLRQSIDGLALALQADFDSLGPNA